jgi:putative FmdB family regulatory protein
MPVYEYLCDGCRKEMEVMQRISEPPLATCPSCGGSLQRLISNTSFILKGTGWYVTDYARKGASATSSPGKTAKEDSSASPAPSSTASDKSD